MSEKLEAMLQAVIDAETDTAYHYASESLTEEQYNLVGKMREWLHTELLHAGIADKF